METTLIKGKFSPTDALHLLQDLEKLKIKYHENKISQTDSEEDIKMRETRIKQIQADFKKTYEWLHSQNKPFIQLESVIHLA